MSSISGCPNCGCKFEMQVAAGVRGNETGRRYVCGSLFSLERNKIYSYGHTCERIAQQDKRIAELEKALRDCVTAVLFTGSDVEVAAIVAKALEQKQ